MQSTEVNIAVVAGIIYDQAQNKVLMSRRRKGAHLEGLWEFPGGKIELGEADYHALQRELKEELDINITSATPFQKINHQYPKKKVSLAFWQVTSFQGDAIGKEGQEIQWVKITDLHKYEFPAANKSIITALSLSDYWLITPDCNAYKSDEFVQTIKTALNKFKITQLLFRSKNLADSDYYKVSTQLKELCLSKGCRLILNRSEINNEKEFGNSWHLTSSQLHQHKKRPSQFSGFLSASCHTLADLKQAEMLQLDCVLLSPVLDTVSHPGAKTIGWNGFKKLAEQTGLSVYALGGISHKELSLARYNGARGIAGISCFK